MNFLDESFQKKILLKNSGSITINAVFNAGRLTGINLGFDLPDSDAEPIEPDTSDFSGKPKETQNSLDSTDYPLLL